MSARIHSYWVIAMNPRRVTTIPGRPLGPCHLDWLCTEALSNAQSVKIEVNLFHAAGFERHRDSGSRQPDTFCAAADNKHRRVRPHGEIGCDRPPCVGYVVAGTCDGNWIDPRRQRLQASGRHRGRESDRTPCLPTGPCRDQSRMPITASHRRGYIST